MCHKERGKATIDAHFGMQHVPYSLAIELPGYLGHTETADQSKAKS